MEHKLLGLLFAQLHLSGMTGWANPVIAATRRRLGACWRCVVCAELVPAGHSWAGQVQGKGRKYPQPVLVLRNRGHHLPSTSFAPT